MRWLATQTSEQAQLQLTMEGLEEDVIELPPETAIAVFRTVQEAVANVVKHARATQLKIRAQVGARLTLEISDDGRGVPVGSDSKTGSHGLKQMRFRMEAVGGTLHIGWRSPTGTSILLTVPLEQRRTRAGLVQPRLDVGNDLRQPLEVLVLVEEVLHAQLLGALAVLWQRVVRHHHRGGAVGAVDSSTPRAGADLQLQVEYQQVHRQFTQRLDGRGLIHHRRQHPHPDALHQQLTQALGDAR